MTKKLILFSALILTAVFLSCNSKKPKAEVVKPGDATVFGVYTNPDSTKTTAILFRRITEAIVYDSVKKKKIISTDTFWGKPMFLNQPLKDTAGRDILDSNGKVVIDPRPTYFLISKDSVRWKGIEGVSIDSLLKKSNPPRG